jgi:hypothetical protein
MSSRSGPIRPDEGVLGQVCGQLRVAEHPDQVRVDLALVLGKEPFDERARRDGIGRERLGRGAGDGRVDGDHRIGGRLEERRDLVRLRRRDVAPRDHRAHSPAEREIDEHGSSATTTRRGRFPRFGQLTTGAGGV